MGLIRVIGRFLAYGSIGVMLAYPAIYDRGYQHGTEHSEEQSYLERLSGERYMFHHPSTDDRYLLDLDRMKVGHYDDLEEKILRDVFSRGD